MERIKRIFHLNKSKERLGFSVDAARIQFAEDLKEVAPDLDSYGLAEKYTDSLFKKLTETGASTQKELITAGEKEFYHVGKDVLGPLAVQFVHEVLEQTPRGKIVFLARDATPFYYVAKALVEEDKKKYAVDSSNLAHETFHRNFWGVNDEQVGKPQKVLTAEDPMVQKLLKQMGFGSDEPVTIVDVGAWGSMVDHLRRELPALDFNLYFFYTHLPEYIYGYTNIHAQADGRRTPIPDDVLEAIADTWEAFPKYIKRQEQLIEQEGKVLATGDGTVVDSPYLKAWHEAAIKGLEDAAKEFVKKGKTVDPHSELLRLWDLSERAKQGEFTGILPGHTQTWSEGDKWKANWPWGRIPPLQ